MHQMHYLCGFIDYYLFPETLGLEHPDPIAFKQIANFTDHMIARMHLIADAVINIRRDLKHKHKNFEDRAEEFDPVVKKIYEEFLQLSNRDFTTLLAKVGASSKIISGGARYILEKLTEGNKKYMGVEPQDYLDTLSVCKWLGSLDRNLATKEAVKEAYNYVKETAKDWVSPWKKKRFPKRNLYDDLYDVDLNYYLFPETIGLKNPDPNVFNQIGKFIGYRLTLAVHGPNRPELDLDFSDYDMRIRVLADLNHKHKKSVMIEVENGLAKFLDREAKKAYEDFLKLSTHDFTTLLAETAASDKNLTGGARYVLEMLTVGYRKKHGRKASEIP